MVEYEKIIHGRLQIMRYTEMLKSALDNDTMSSLSLALGAASLIPSTIALYQGAHQAKALQEMIGAMKGSGIMSPRTLGGAARDAVTSVSKSVGAGIGKGLEQGLSEAIAKRVAKIL